MATSYFLRPSSPLEREEPHESMVVGEQKIRSSETVKQKAGKNGKAATNRKKQPQRGLGVAQLERLISQPDCGPVSPNLQHPFYQFQFPSTYGVPAATVPVPFGGGAGAGDGQGSFGFIPWRYTINGGFAGVSVQTTLDQVPASPFEPKELTSIQMMHCSSDHCDICFKKKRINGESLAYKPNMGMMNGHDYLGLSLGRRNAIDGNMKTQLNVDEGAEVMAVKGESVLMEYEFFPHKASGSGSSSYMDSEGTVGVGSPSPSSTDASFLDLSLKLSW